MAVLEIEDEMKSRRLLDRNVARLCAVKNFGSSGILVKGLGLFQELWQAIVRIFEAEIFLFAQAVVAALDDADFVVETLDEAQRDGVFRSKITKTGF